VSGKADKDQKTEKPTPQRKKEARQKGQIARSPDLAGWVIIIGATYLVPNTAARVFESMQEVMRRYADIARNPDPRQAAEALGLGLSGSLVAVLPMLATAAALGLVTTLAQVGFVFSGKPLAPKAERLNPLAGLKKQFSTKALWETVKSLAKLGAVAAVAIPAVTGLARELVGGPKVELQVVLARVAEAVISLVRMVSLIALIIAFADYAYQRRQTNKAMMMTKVEMKQENKSSEGDPMVKGKIRALQRAASRNRMLSAIPDANVVIMNPMHFAVALRYRAHEGAPRVVAKGRDQVALRIRDRAQEHGVPVVEAPPLARALYKACEIDQEIPNRLFTGVAKVLAFVHRLNGRSSLSGVFVLNDIPLGEDEDTGPRPAARAS
jgi:flagellar biosynthetic protein FlhB